MRFRLNIDVRKEVEDSRLNAIKQLITFVKVRLNFSCKSTTAANVDLAESRLDNWLKNNRIAMFLVTSPIVINVPIRGLLAVETMHAIVQWLANLNIKRNVTSMFVNKKHRYYRR